MLIGSALPSFFRNEDDGQHHTPYRSAKTAATSTNALLIVPNQPKFWLPSHLYHPTHPHISHTTVSLKTVSHTYIHIQSLKHNHTVCNTQIHTPQSVTQSHTHPTHLLHKHTQTHPHSHTPSTYTHIPHTHYINTHRHTYTHTHTHIHTHNSRHCIR